MIKEYIKLIIEQTSSEQRFYDVAKELLSNKETLVPPERISKIFEYYKNKIISTNYFSRNFNTDFLIKLIAGHGNTPVHVLESIMENYATILSGSISFKEILREICRNKNINSSIIAKIMDLINYRALPFVEAAKELAVNPKLTDQNLIDLYNINNIDIKKAVLLNKRVPKELLYGAARSDDQDLVHRASMVSPSVDKTTVEIAIKNPASANFRKELRILYSKLTGRETKQSKLDL